MNFDWLTNLLPIINATGIPLLVVGIFLLLRAYQKATEISKSTATYLSEENERLRKRLVEVNTFAKLRGRRRLQSWVDHAQAGNVFKNAGQ